MKVLINYAALLLAVSGTCMAQTNSGSNAGISAEQFIHQAAIGGMKEVATGKIAQKNAQDPKIKSFGMMMTTDHTRANDELKMLAKAKKIKLPKASSGDAQTGTSGSGSAGTGAGTGNAGTTGTMGQAGTAGNTGSTGNTTTTGTGTGTTGTNGSMGQTGTGGSTGSTGNTIGSGSTGAGGNTGQTGSAGGNTGSTGNTAANGMMSSSMRSGSDSLMMMTEQDIGLAVQQLGGLKGSAFDQAYTQMMISDHKNAIALYERGSQSADPDIKAFATKHLPTLRTHLSHISGMGSNSGQQMNHSGKNNR